MAETFDDQLAEALDTMLEVIRQQQLAGRGKQAAEDLADLYEMVRNQEPADDDASDQKNSVLRRIFNFGKANNLL